MSEDEQSIPASHHISRHIFFPIMYDSDQNLVWGNIFMFQQKYDYCESVVWRKYATLEEVHELGCAKAERDRNINNKDRKYGGASTAKVGSAREIVVLDSNASIEVEHDPSENQGIHHAHIRLLLPVGVRKLKPSEKTELRLILSDVFSDFDPYPL